MVFYITAASLTLLLLGIVFWPALRKAEPAASAPEHDFDLVIYKDQLRELDADIARGTMAPAEADYARAEIARRLIAAEAVAEKEQAARGVRRAGAPMLVAAALFAPLAAILIYSITGSPGMEAQPLYARAAEIEQQQNAQSLQNMSVEKLVAAAEAALAKNPEDGRGWDVLAPMYLRLGRPGDARTAFEKAIALLGESAGRRAGLGQAYFMLAGDTMDVHAKAEFDRAIALDPADARARFFVALGAAESGDTAGALAGWKQMAEDTTTPEEGRAAANEGLRRYGGEAMASVPPASAPQLDEQTMQNAQNMTAEDRQAMIGNMVAQLDARLRENPDDVAGWQRLIRSYAVLGRTADAQDALKRALQAFAGDEAKHGEIVQFAAAIGLSATESTQ